MKNLNVILFLLLLPSYLVSQSFIQYQISGNTTQNKSPQISEEKIIVWHAVDQNGVKEIFKKHYLSEPISLVSTGSSINNQNAQIDGNTIVWRGTDAVSGQQHIYKNAGSGQIQVSTSSTENFLPRVEGGVVVWYGKGAEGTFQIFKDEGSGPVMVSNPMLTDMNRVPFIDNGVIVWEGRQISTGEFHIFMDAGSGPEQISLVTTDNNEIPYKNGSDIVWRGFFKSQPTVAQIFKYNGSTTTAITINSKEKKNPVIDNGITTWEEYGNVTFQIYQHSNTDGIQLVSDGISTNNIFPRIDNNKIVWMGRRDPDADVQARIFQIYINKDLEGQMRITELETTMNMFPKIYDGTIVWEGNDGNTSHIYAYNCFNASIPSEIPVLSTWMIIILFFIMTIMGVIYVGKKNTSLNFE